EILRYKITNLLNQAKLQCWFSTKEFYEIDVGAAAKKTFYLSLNVVHFHLRDGQSKGTLFCQTVRAAKIALLCKNERYTWRMPSQQTIHTVAFDCGKVGSRNG